MAPCLRGREPFDLEAILERTEAQVPAGNPSALAAVDMALHDLIGKKLGLPLWKYWGLDRAARRALPSPSASPRWKKSWPRWARREKYPILKIKVGVANDLEILREVRRLAPKKTLRVDANCGWTVRETIAKAKALEKLGVEFIEQPIPPGNNAALKTDQERHRPAADGRRIQPGARRRPRFARLRGRHQHQAGQMRRPARGDADDSHRARLRPEDHARLHDRIVACSSAPRRSLRRWPTTRTWTAICSSPTTLSRGCGLTARRS